MSMEKKLVALASMLAALAVTVIILWFIVLPSSPAETTISGIVSDLESWVNKRVRVNGIMIGPLMSIPEVKLPYNCWLQDEDNRTITIGVKCSEEMLENSQYVTVIGTVKAGYTEGLMGGDLVYYIEAEKIEVLE